MKIFSTLVTMALVLPAIAAPKKTPEYRRENLKNPLKRVPKKALPMRPAPFKPAPTPSPTEGAATGALAPVTGGAIETTAAVVPPPSKRSPIALSVVSEFIGPDLSRMADRLPDLSTAVLDPNDPVRQESQVKAGYRIDSEWTAGLGQAVFFVFKPNPKEDFFVFKDPFAYVTKKKLIHSGGFNLNAEARIYFGFTRDTQKYNTIGGGRLIQDMTFDFDQSPWGLGLYLFEHGSLIWLAKIGQPDSKFFFNPYVQYRVTDNFQAILAYENLALHLVGQPFFRLTSAFAGLKPQVNWDIRPNFSFNPYIVLNVGNRVTMNTTTFGAVFVWGIL